MNVIARNHLYTIIHTCTCTVHVQCIMTIELTTCLAVHNVPLDRNTSSWLIHNSFNAERGFSFLNRATIYLDKADGSASQLQGGREDNIVYVYKTFESTHVQYRAHGCYQLNLHVLYIHYVHVQRNSSMWTPLK